MSAVLDMSDSATRSRVEALQRLAGDSDVDLANCCEFLLGTPTFVSISGDYARATVSKALEAQGREHRAADPGAVATGTLEPGTTTGEIEGSSGQDGGDS